MRKVAEGDTVHVIRRMSLKPSLDVIKGVAMRMRAHSAGEVLRGRFEGRKKVTAYLDSKIWEQLKMAKGISVHFTVSSVHVVR